MIHVLHDALQWERVSQKTGPKTMPIYVVFMAYILKRYADDNNNSKKKEWKVCASCLLHDRYENGSCKNSLRMKTF